VSPFWGHVAGIITVIVMVAFIGIWVWAWLPYHRRTFDALASLPLEDMEDTR
jgi:cytochrome c oxidase cbb3-type subunit IV